MTRRPFLVLVLLLCAVMTLGLVGCDSSTFTTSSTISEKQDETSEQQPELMIPSEPTSLTGAGASLPTPVYVDWIGGFQEAYPQITLDYSALGPEAAFERFTDQRLDFCTIDGYLDKGQIAVAEAAHPGTRAIQIPTVIGAVVLAYNLPGVDDLRLDSDTIVDIFLGEITQWAHPAIVALNPDAALPEAEIVVLHEPEASATTTTFTAYLSKISDQWTDEVGSDSEVDWPTGIAAEKSMGVAPAVESTENSIGYVTFSYTLQHDTPIADIENAAGDFVTPTLESIGAAATGMRRVPQDLRIDVLGSSDSDAYPIVSMSYVVFYDPLGDPDKTAALMSFLTWSLGPEGSDLAEALGYAPLPSSVREKVLQNIALIEP